jgi:hypothetical protein
MQKSKGPAHGIFPQLTAFSGLSTIIRKEAPGIRLAKPGFALAPSWTLREWRVDKLCPEPKKKVASTGLLETRHLVVEVLPGHMD